MIPTLILGENQELIVSGAVSADDSLGEATIGRPFVNEAFIKVGENVITSLGHYDKERYLYRYLVLLEQLKQIEQLMIPICYFFLFCISSDQDRNSC